MRTFVLKNRLIITKVLEIFEVRDFVKLLYSENSDLFDYISRDSIYLIAIDLAYLVT